jgi:hypothetical protein
MDQGRGDEVDGRTDRARGYIITYYFLSLLLSLIILNWNLTEIYLEGTFDDDKF